VTAWRREQTRDRFFQAAKKSNYRARSAFKLLEINRRAQLVRAGDVVLDLGAAPGSWSQVLTELGASVIAVDLSPIEALKGVTTLQADICLDVEAIAAALPRAADVVVSDVSPQVSGNRLLDHVRSIELAEASVALAVRLSKQGGNFAVKVFQGEDFDGFVGRVKQAYAQTRVIVPEATRQESREAYVVALHRL